MLSPHTPHFPYRHLCNFLWFWYSFFWRITSNFWKHGLRIKNTGVVESWGNGVRKERRFGVSTFLKWWGLRWIGWKVGNVVKVLECVEWGVWRIGKWCWKGLLGLCLSVRMWCVCESGVYGRMGCVLGLCWNGGDPEESGLSLLGMFFCLPKRNQHRLRRGLPGYLILFAPRAFAPQCQSWARKVPSLSVFLLISKNLTSPLEILFSSLTLQMSRLVRTTKGKLWDFTNNRTHPPTRPLRPIIPNNTRSFCITAAAGTEFAGASFSRHGIISSTPKCLLLMKGFYNQKYLRHPRDIAGSGFRPLSKIPHCCLP